MSGAYRDDATRRAYGGRYTQRGRGPLVPYKRLWARAHWRHTAITKQTRRRIAQYAARMAALFEERMG